MFQEERIEAIMEYLREHQRMDVKEICDRFDVSRDTARRDLVRMDELGLIVRTRGGAMLPTLNRAVTAYKDRMQRAPDEKRQIGREAAKLIRDGHYLFLDTSTTVATVAEHIRTTGNVVVTNSIDIAAKLADNKSLKVHMLGGQLELEHRFLFGATALAQLADYYVDTLFLGACGISPDGLSYPHEEDGSIKREMIRRADRVVVLADHTKFGKQLFYKVAGLDDLDVIVTDREPEESMLRLLERHDVELLIVEGDNQHD
ncbi:MULTISPECIES: DeoR/GlpR family DNA-binding transcription regulator [unclassified Paenibacillus]|uniref:DeoR/GlpR family DNA-binding transcription regulator n=1 Tax=unclassified Paenibacillus TaxID=185978 RepID=UPI00020D7EB9|nr:MULTISPECIES: DeoR/GlpR family DNA-binding transcription regulator [unclassified Paenibacillus]EGL19178.1 HTH-type transcriptional repressor GlcR [Paenibacillus sp. HGF7]EPD81114.1 hypothetical protein HMPREF1207_04871 [Paenibacillus sp. HGH0039]